MSRLVGTTVRGIRCPIIREGDDLAEIVCQSIVDASIWEDFELHDKDVVGITESVLARAQGNYCTVDEIAEDVKQQFAPATHLGVLFPILSRNRFSMLLKGIARGMEHITLMLSYPSDEVGNQLVSRKAFRTHKVSSMMPGGMMPEARFRIEFGNPTHPFTGVDYLAYYREIIEGEGCACDIYICNDPTYLLHYTKSILCCDIHTRFETMARLQQADPDCHVLTLNSLMYSKNRRYGLLGSNKASEEKVKLFPNDCQEFVEKVQQLLQERTGKTLEVMIYGDGAFKDPVGGIWELADPVVSPGYTKGLAGTPNEVKIKYLADNDYGELRGKALVDAIKSSIKEKDANLVGQMISEGTTPRRLTDLLGSLCDLTSGSGDKGTPIVLVQGYFDNYATE